MYDLTPGPIGELTRRWTTLTDAERAQSADARLGRLCGGDHLVHVEHPAHDDGTCYAQLVRLALDGDAIALGWLATSHRALLIARGQVLLDHDPTEWGAVCLEALHTTLAKVDLGAGRWVRRRVAQRLTLRVSNAAAVHVARRHRERPTAPVTLARACGSVDDPDHTEHLDLRIALDGVLRELDSPTRDAFCALADGWALAGVAQRHGLSHGAIRQRVSRARTHLQAELAGFVRAGT